MRNEKVLTKQWHNTETARTGVMAALLAQQNLSGPEFILEGPQGLFNAMSDDTTPDAFLAQSPHWRIFDCSFKPSPACQHAHPAIDVLTELLALHDLNLSQIDRVEVDVYKDARVFCDRVHPQTELQAKFSIQHALAAVLLLWGQPQLEHYTPDAFNQPACSKLREHISLFEYEQLEAAYPHHFGAKCTVILKDGQRLSHYQQDTLGDPEKPLSQQQLIDKANIKQAVRKLSESTTRKCNKLIGISSRMSCNGTR